MYAYEKQYDKVMYVPSGKKGIADRRILLEKLNTDGVSSEETRLLNALMQQKKAEFTKGTIFLFPKGICPCVPDAETQCFEIVEYACQNGAVFTSESVSIYINESALEDALVPIIEIGYKGYAVILNLYKHRGSKNRRRLYMGYF